MSAAHEQSKRTFRSCAGLPSANIARKAATISTSWTGPVLANIGKTTIAPRHKTHAPIAISAVPAPRPSREPTM